MSLGNSNARRKFLTSLALQQHLAVGTQAMTSDTSQLDQRVQSALTGQAGVPQRNLRFEASEGRVTLHGTVHSYYQKQMAQEALRSLEGVQSIDNKIEVSWI